MANILFIFLILLIEGVIFGITFSGLNKKNIIPRTLFGGVIASFGSLILAINEYSQGKYQLEDIFILNIIFALFSYAILICVTVWIGKKEKSTDIEESLTTEEVILTYGDSVRVIKEGKIILKLTVRTGGIGLKKHPDNNFNEEYTSFRELHWVRKDHNEDFITGSPCLAIKDIDEVRQLIVIQAKPGYYIDLK